MPIILRTVGEYREAIKTLRKFTTGFEAHKTVKGVLVSTGYDLRTLQDTKDFRNPLTGSERAKIARYFDVYQRHAAYKGTVIQRFKDPKRLREAQAAMGMPVGKGWRGVFVPQPSDATGAKLVKIKKKWIIEYVSQGVDTIFVPFDRVLFAVEGEDYVRELFAGADPAYRYNLDMGYGRNRWSSGGNLEQMIRDMGYIMARYGHYSEFIMGVHVYRGTNDNFNKLKTEHFKTVAKKKITQAKIKVRVRRERRQLHDWNENIRLAKKYPGTR